MCKKERKERGEKQRLPQLACKCASWALPETCHSGRARKKCLSHLLGSLTFISVPRTAEKGVAQTLANRCAVTFPGFLDVKLFGKTMLVADKKLGQLFGQSAQVSLCSESFLLPGLDL